jgi:lysozyme
MRTSDGGLEKLKAREGWRNRAYLDMKNIPTIGVGHTGPEVYIGLVWTPQQIQDALKDDVVECETTINRYVKVALQQNQFDALVSFIFNVGVTAFIRSTLLRILNTGDYKGAAKAFDMWHIPKEIIGRRDSEKEQFLA